jgi:probable F420-dependent oxidoreductase
MENAVKLGCFVPQLGEIASPESMKKAAQHAEKLGYNSLWVTERLLFPVNPRNPYGAAPDGKLPAEYSRVFDPVGTLTYVAAVTEKIRLGTSVLDMPFYNPVMLGRQLTSLDVLSNGRLNVGLGQGWSDDEYEASGAATKQKGARASEFLEVLHVLWKDTPAQYDGKFFKLAASRFDLNPVQKPHPPIYLAAFSPGALNRTARLADGWMPVALPPAAVAAMWTQIKQMAEQAGRNPSDLRLLYRGNVNLTEKPLGEGRWPFSGSKDEIAQDMAAIRELGTHELVMDVSFSPNVKSPDAFIETNEILFELATKN